MTNTEGHAKIESTNPVLTVAPIKEETEMSGATNKITALYCRLSQEDERARESLSIENQKAILLSYCKDHHFGNPKLFIDDGYSGVNYDRPGFQAMLAEIEAGHVAVCITLRRIFQMCMEGRSTPHPDPETPYGWCDSSVVNILERREYTGCTVNFKTYTNSIWDKKQRDNPIEKQAVFPRHSRTHH